MQINMKSAKNASKKIKNFGQMTGWNNVKFVKFFVDYFNDPWIRWQTKAMFVLWIMSWLAGFVISGWALFTLPLTFVHTILTAAFAFCSATIFWVSLHRVYLDGKLSEETASYELVC